MRLGWIDTRADFGKAASAGSGTSPVWSGSPAAGSLLVSVTFTQSPALARMNSGSGFFVPALMAASSSLRA